MAQVFFHCSTDQVVLIDRHGGSVADLIEAREQAAGVVRSFIATPIGCCMLAMRRARSSLSCPSHP